MTQPTIIRFWHRLAALKRMVFYAQPGPESWTGWRGHGWAEISITRVGDDLWQQEQGYFQQTGHTRPMPFDNMYHWQYRPDHLQLWHERFGRQAPVWLFDLWAPRVDCLVSGQPHLCRADAYTARLTLTAHGFDMGWRIRGPGKDERLDYQYLKRADVACDNGG